MDRPRNGGRRRLGSGAKDDKPGADSIGSFISLMEVEEMDLVTNHV